MNFFVWLLLLHLVHYNILRISDGFDASLSDVTVYVYKLSAHLYSIVIISLWWKRRSNTHKEMIEADCTFQCDWYFLWINFTKVQSTGDYIWVISTYQTLRHAFLFRKEAKRYNIYFMLMLNTKTCFFLVFPQSIHAIH